MVFGSTKPVLNRDIQILIGEQIATSSSQIRYVDEGIFNLFVASPIICSSAITALSKLTTFTLNERQARIAEGDRNAIYIDFRSLTGYTYFKQLVKLVMESNGKFFTVLHLISLKGMDISQLFEIFMLLKDITVISLPYEFDAFARNGGSKKLDKLIGRNASTLQSIRHLTYPFSLQPEIRDKIVSINASTLRTGSLEKENDFFAFYMDTVGCPPELLLPADGGISMHICIHRYKDALRSIKRALQRDKLRSKITLLNLCAIYDFDVKSAQTLLLQLKNIRSILPNLNMLVLTIKSLESYPDFLQHIPVADDDMQEWEDEVAMIPPSAPNFSSVANFVLDYLSEQKFDFAVKAKAELAVDYHFGPDSCEPTLLEKVLKQTISRSLGSKWTKTMEGTVITSRNGGVSSDAVICVNDKLEFEFSIKFTTIIACPKNYERNIFRVIHSL